MPSLEELRVVISSPGDVEDERKTLADVIEKLNKNIAERSGVTLSVRRWEDAPLGFWKEGVQHHLDSFLKIEDSDLFIGILWKRFGTPGKDSKTGTEHEFIKAYEAWEKNKRPEIMLYFNQNKYLLTTPEDAEQLTAVLNFKDKIRKGGEGLYHQYIGLEEFKEKVDYHLHGFILNYLQEAKTNIKQPLSNKDLDEVQKIRNTRMQDYKIIGSAITVCCRGMETMIKDGTIVPFTTWGENTGQMFVRGRNKEIFNYNSVRYCPFCATQITLKR
jgi:hypothetical protein